MAGYSKIRDTVFSGATGRELRKHSAEVREVQFWLLAGPGREPFGIFIFEPEMVAPQLGRPAKKIRESIATLVDLGFCKWDEETNYVWVIEMAHHQFDAPLKRSDFRCKTAQKWYAAHPRNPFMGEWFDRYLEDFHLAEGEHAVERRDWTARDATRDAPSQGASMPLVLLCSDPDSVQGSIENQEGVVSNSALVPAPALDPAAPLKGRPLEDAFERVWTRHPNAADRKESRAQFGRLKPSAQLVDTMLAAIAVQERSDQWGRGYIPGLAKWLKGHRWEDRLKPATGAQSNLTDRNARNVSTAQRFVERRRGQGE